MAGGSTPQVPTVDPDPAWLQQEEYQAGAYETQQQQVLAKGDTANFMARYGVRTNLSPNTAVSETSVLYGNGGMDPRGLGPGAANPLLVTLAGGGSYTAPGNPTATQPAIGVNYGKQ